jgi:uncharacterized protein YdaU (DUF1376 family)
MPAHAFYRFFTGDYLRDAGHLSLLEHGAYRRLIDLYMTTAEPLPFDMPRLYRLLHATSKEEQQAVQVVVEEFFRMDGQLLRHSRCDRELAWQREMSEISKRANEARWSRTKKNQELTSVRNPVGSKADSEPEPEPEPEPEKEQELLSHFVDTEVAADVRTAAPISMIASMYNATCKSCVEFQVRNPTRDKHIAARWRQIFSQKAVNDRQEALKFFGDFFARVQASPFLTGRTSSPGRKPFRASLDWLMLPDNFAKVIEGKYDS